MKNHYKKYSEKCRGQRNGCLNNKRSDHKAMSISIAKHAKLVTNFGILFFVPRKKDLQYRSYLYRELT